MNTLKQTHVNNTFSQLKCETCSIYLNFRQGQESVIHEPVLNISMRGKYPKSIFPASECKHIPDDLPPCTQQISVHEDFFVLFFLGCFTSWQHSVSQRQICQDNFICYHTNLCRSYRSHLQSHPVTLFKHQANWSYHWANNTRLLARQLLECHFLRYWFDSARIGSQDLLHSNADVIL